MTTIAISTTTDRTGEYARAVAATGASVRLLDFDVVRLDVQLAGVDGVLLSGGGDVDPRRYGVASDLADDLSPKRDDFELALVRYARRRALPTLCICRGVQIANVAFGGTLVPDIATVFDERTAALHRFVVNGNTERGIVAGHEVTVEAPSLLATIAAARRVVTGSRHHQSVARVADDLRVVATTDDGVVEALEARFASPFWLGVQWHPESTVDADSGLSRAIFSAFGAAAARFHEATAS